MSNPPPNSPAQEGDAFVSPAPERSALTLDIQEYLGQLTDWDISESQKREFIVAFWNLLATIAEFNLGIHPAQTAAAKGRKKPKKAEKVSTEKTPKKPELPTFHADDVLRSNPYYRTQIIECSDSDALSEESKSPS